jgi:hypothetical protein
MRQGLIWYGAGPMSLSITAAIALGKPGRIFYKKEKFNFLNLIAFFIYPVNFFIFLLDLFCASVYH